MERPSCPVCLEFFDSSSVIPRVLPCGHTFCERCIVSLHQGFTGTFRCPLCYHLIGCLDTSIFPKNIDLMRVSLQYPNSETLEPVIQHQIPCSRTGNSVFSLEEWIIPSKGIIIEGSDHREGLLLGNLVSHHSRAMDGQQVALIPFHTGFSESISKFISEEEKQELGLIFRISSRLQRVSPCYGLWCSRENNWLYLAFQGRNLSVSKKLGELRSIPHEDTNMLPGLTFFGMIGMEICEVLFSLHMEGLLLGCFNFSSFCFHGIGSICVDLCDFMVIGRKLCSAISDAISVGEPISDAILMKILKLDAFPSPEVLYELLWKESVACDFSFCSVSTMSDVWCLGCMLLEFLLGEEFTERLVSFMLYLFSSKTKDSGTFSSWRDTIAHLLETRLGEKYINFSEILSNCIHFDPSNRPSLRDVWRCLRELIIHPQYDINWEETGKEIDGRSCLLLGKLCKFSMMDMKFKASCISEVDRLSTLCLAASSGKFEVTDIQGHLDCVTGLAVGGNFLLSSSFDKTVCVWSLQNFKLVHCFRGHEHRITAVVYIDDQQPLCISADVGGIILIWNLTGSPSHEPVKKLYEQKDWRYDGIHALAVSPSLYLYTGSGDKSIKVWSLQDYEVITTMFGHNSVVSALAIYDDVLYSGSWDGTVRLWSMRDHSPLTVLSRSTVPALSLSIDQYVLAVAYQDGNLTIWQDDRIMKSFSVHRGVVYAAHVRGPFLFTGGWDKTLLIQKVIQEGSRTDMMLVGSIPVGSVVRAINYSQGKLVAGFSDGSIKVFSK